jgi:hypothetical protein
MFKSFEIPLNAILIKQSLMKTYINYKDLLLVAILMKKKMNNFQFSSNILNKHTNNSVPWVKCFKQLNNQNASNKAFAKVIVSSHQPASLTMYFNANVTILHVLLNQFREILAKEHQILLSKTSKSGEKSVERYVSRRLLKQMGNYSPLFNVCGVTYEIK